MEVDPGRIEQELRVLAIRIQQQERIIGGLRAGIGRLEALSTLAELLRTQDELERRRAAALPPVT